MDLVGAPAAFTSRHAGMVKHELIDLRRSKVICRCGWNYALEEQSDAARDRDRLLDAYNTHRRSAGARHE